MGEPIVVETVLAPVDGSEDSERAAEYALAIAERYEARVHVLYVFNEILGQRVALDGVEADAAVERSESFMATIEDRAEDVPVSHSTAFGFSPTMKSLHPGKAVLDAADDAEIDFIVLPRVSVSGTPETSLEKAAGFVVDYATQPVLSV
ncbi:universal stress protein [Halococcus hamelinensis]|uniref:UspA domain-containing protein n=1 Tax=Halococcus hamelinensis 100A6 TaxID=1132509 RepID=M0LYQ9_9EURY|nr:universal stress protein [Halococcus hamelinensis]EMA38561.1 UspA domain-containing protein [Halococcus hamelinensis 100A6]